MGWEWGWVWESRRKRVGENAPAAGAARMHECVCTGVREGRKEGLAGSRRLDAGNSKATHCVLDGPPPCHARNPLRSPRSLSQPDCTVLHAHARNLHMGGCAGGRHALHAAARAPAGGRDAEAGHPWGGCGVRLAVHKRSLPCQLLLARWCTCMRVAAATVASTAARQHSSAPAQQRVCVHTSALRQHFLGARRATCARAGLASRPAEAPTAMTRGRGTRTASTGRAPRAAPRPTGARRRRRRRMGLARWGGVPTAPNWGPGCMVRGT